MAVLFQFGGFEQIIINMQNMGFFQFLFPFLLALAIVYGVLSTALPKTLPKSARGLIAIIVAFFVMLYGSWNMQIVTFLANISGYWLMVGCGILFVIILLGLMGLKPEQLWGAEGERKAKWIFAVLIIFIGFLIFLGAGASSVVNIPTLGSDFWTIIFFIIILALAMFWMGSGKEEDEGETGKRSGGG